MKFDKESLLLYAVTDRYWLGPGETLVQAVEKALKGGTTFVQLREKELDEETFLEEARQLKELCRQYNVPFVINDNVDIAMAMDADGVHVGQSDMETGEVRALLGTSVPNLVHPKSSAFLRRPWNRHCWHRRGEPITWELERYSQPVPRMMQTM